MSNNQINKEYLLFMNHTYYPSAGFGNFVGVYDTIEEALDIVNKEAQDSWPKDYYEIVDKETLESIRSGDIEDFREEDSLL